MIKFDTIKITKDSSKGAEWITTPNFLVILAKKGDINIQTGKGLLSLKKGDAAFLFENSIYKIDGEGDLELETLFFSKDELGLNDDSANKSALRFCSHHSASSLLFPITYSLGKEMASMMNKIKDVIARKDEFYSLESRQCVLAMFLIAINQMKRKETKKNQYQKKDDQITKMISYINQNYEKPITLKEIAKATSISERACLRVFQNTIHDSPTQYLLKKRLDVASKLLQEDSSTPIKDIARKVGFSSPSYFTELFHRYYHKTPKEYLSIIAITKWSDNPFGALEDFFKN